jgi:hypothetical protein
MMAREALILKVTSKVENIQIADVEEKIGFPIF